MKLPFVRRKALTADPAVVEALRDRRFAPIIPLGGTNQRISEAYQRGQSASYAWMYGHQPAVRAVIEYIAKNMAQLPLKLYERVSDTERERKEDHPAAKLMHRPGPQGRGPTGRQFIFEMVVDYLIFDNSYALKFNAGGGNRSLIRVPAAGVTVSGGRFWPESYRFWRLDGTFMDVSPDDVVHWKGYDPSDALIGVSKLETLRRELAGDLASQETTKELLETGLRGGYIKRPVEAPEWDEQALKRFQEGWTNALRASPRRTPVLDEGMEFEDKIVTPRDAQLLQARKFTVEEVCRLYGLPGAVINLDGGGLGDARAEVYADVLPPLTTSLAEQLDMDILEEEFNESDYYYEFDLNEKLRGDLENRFPAMTAAAGRPWMTVDEVRARENLPPVKDGDKLTIPMNVQLAGQQGSPSAPQLPAANVMPPQNPLGPPQDGSHRNGQPTPQGASERPLVKADPSAEVTDVLLRFYRRMEGFVSNGHQVSEKRWARELANDLEPIVGKGAQIEQKADGLVGIIAGMLEDGAWPPKVFARARESAPRMATLLAGSVTATPEDLKSLDVPRELIWERAGFSPAEIDRMASMKHAEDLIRATTPER